MKKMDLFVDDGQFKIDDTNTILHFTATVDRQPQSFPTTDSLMFQINENALSSIGDEVSMITLQEMQKQLQDQVKNEVAKQVAALPKPKDGMPGTDGQTPTLSIGPVDQLPAGSAPAVKEYGSGLDYVWGFSFPQASIETKTITSGSLQDYKSTALCIGSGVGTDAPTQHRFTLIVIADADGGSQHLTDLENGQSWDRTFDSGGFKEWRQVTQWN